MKARISSLTFGRNGESYLTLATTENVTALYDELHEGDVRVEIKKWKERRSPNANAYAWALIDKLAEVNNLPPKEVYRRAVRNIGGNSVIACVQNRAVEMYCRLWDGKGDGWQTETLDSKLDDCTNIKLYYGSSVYDTAQMSRLIDLLVQDCKACGIPTMPQEKIDSLLARWDEA